LHQRIVDEAIPAPRRKALHRKVLRAADLTDAERARHLCVTGPSKDARKTSLEAGEALLKLGRASEALELLTAAHKLAADDLTLAVRCAEVSMLVGDYDGASALAESAARSRNASVKARAIRVLAQRHRHAGELDQAITLIDRARALEVFGLAHLYSAQRDEARSAFNKLASLAESMGNLRLQGREHGLRALIAQRDGKLADAASLVERAARLSSKAGANHAAAVFELNLGTIEQRRGRYAAALEAYNRARPGITRAGTPAQLAAFHYNRGHLLAILGELESADRAAELAAKFAAAASDLRFAVYARLLTADILRRRHEVERAEAAYRSALELAEKSCPSEVAVARTGLADLLAQRRNPAALGLLAEVSTDSVEREQELQLVRLRAELALSVDPSAKADAIGALRDGLLERQELDLAWRFAVQCARLHRNAGDLEFARSEAEQARELIDECLELAPEAYRIGFRRDPDAQALQALLADLSIGGSETGERPGLGDAPLRRLLRLSRRLNSELRLDVLLDDVMDTAIELSDADRGFLLLRDESGTLQISVARHIDQATLAGEPGLSRSIAERVVQDGEFIVTTNAGEDLRFGASESVAAFQLRSVLCVPLRVKSRIVGALYLDHRFRMGAFDGQATVLLAERADIAAVAIENARLLRENSARQERIDELNQALTARLERAEADLVAAKARLGSVSPVDARDLGLVGDSAPMRKVYDLIERASSCDLSVVIEGESGTGKELVARAIHRRSSRAEQPFVAINCGAVPDSLLEAELFGHRRGAFTGAERSRRGLFEVADGGTLFLDEVAETSLAMQAKLLRVLQDGEVRPLGAEASLRVDVRILSACHENLEALVSAGRFREDLFYRLHVLNIVVPPLRERAEDIPALVEHLLARAKGLAPLQLSREALRSLALFDWPGNVRQLENELARATVQSDGNIIEIGDLSVATLRSAPEGQASADLRLKPQVEALERQLVEEALHKTSGNQTKAAALLGLSRYGLQKKLQRYGISRR
jgi:transcriptional regulator with GAF, ATPase, and Fis domain